MLFDLSVTKNYSLQLPSSLELVSLLISKRLLYSLIIRKTFAQFKCLQIKNIVLFGLNESSLQFSCLDQISVDWNKSCIFPVPITIQLHFTSYFVHNAVTLWSCTLLCMLQLHQLPGTTLLQWNKDQNAV